MITDNERNGQQLKDGLSEEPILDLDEMDEDPYGYNGYELGGEG